LAAFLKGEARPENAIESLTLARLCESRRLYAAAARFLGDAVADPRYAAQRYDAACLAALAGTGQGQDAARLPEPERARLRKLALAWLRADLETLAQQP